MTNIAIITARGGSKRIPRKVIRPFLGKPIMLYSIETALQSGLFDEVMVSTEDDEIADLAVQHGASVPFRRSAKTADDFATTAEVLSEVLTNYEERGQTFTNACCLYPTAPFVTPVLLQQAFDTLQTRSFDCVFPVQRFGFPVQRAVTFVNDRLTWLQPEHALTRSQDLQPAYHDAGQFYFFNVAVFRQKGRLLTDNTSGLVISEMQAQDIDNEEDWQVAEFKYRLLFPDKKRS
ncbi:pseudaminic acid cytidylyltransferase [Fibrisoma montanum]|uniref:Pseudaminic acid cytidylyltransferase n=1 Tax=Fibrisoma montanum TaxID=2305895 RepID=A0A418MI76_9BACT|nr:pseudaminic acid cytidylyltransferase [Fibrisoma montanum]RIV27117.1 pseudaminic acid cytidylyltransferase [Fibrisoma montanum]